MLPGVGAPKERESLLAIPDTALLHYLRDLAVSHGSPYLLGRMALACAF